MKFPLCQQTVTVYRRTGDQVQRQVLENCFFHWQQVRLQDELGWRQETKCLLLLPGAQQRIAVGDRVLDGIGPEVTVQQWPGFIPVAVPALAEVAYVQPVYWDGALSHWDAGRK